MSLRISLIQQCTQQKQETIEVSFSPDGNYVWSSDWTAIYQWKRGADDDWDYCQCIPGIVGHLQYTPDGKMFVYRGQGGTTHFCTFEGKELMTLSYPNQTGNNYVFSPDQRWFISGDSARNVVLWDMLNHQLSTISYHFPFHGPRRDYNSIYSEEDRQELQTRDDLWRGTAERFQITPDGQRLVFVARSDEGEVHICQVDPLHKRLTLQKNLPFAGMINLKMAANGKMLAISLESKVYLYDLESLQPLHTFSATDGADYGLLAFSPDSQYLMSSKDDGSVDIWSLAIFERSASFAAHPGLMTNWSDPIGGLDWSSTGYIATGGASAFEEDVEKKDYTIKLWRVEQ